MTEESNRDGHWWVTFRWNGRVSGANQVLDGAADWPTFESAHDKVADFEREAVRRDGSIYTLGWTVEWREPPPKG